MKPTTSTPAGTDARTRFKRAAVLLLLILLAAPGLAQPAPNLGLTADSPWFLGPDGGVYRGLERVGPGTGTDLAVAGQTPYVVGMDGLIWSGRGGNWRPFNMLFKAQRLSIGPDGSVLALGLDGGVYRVDAQGWTRVGLATGTDLAGGGTLYVIGMDQKVWFYRSSTWLPFNIVALGKRIAAAPDGTVYLIGTDNGVYQVGEGTALQRLGLGLGKEIAVSATGKVGIVGMDDGVYLWTNNDWQRLGTGTARLVEWPR